MSLEQGTPVGIDDLNLYSGTLSLDVAEVARARGFDPTLPERQGIVRRALPPAWEDPITLAVNAAKPIVEAAGRDAFELLIVATESSIDYAKPISTYVHRHLGLQTRCRNFEMKHACYGGAAALQMATAWVRSGVAPGKKALVIASDMGRKYFDHPVEMVKGAGAVAISVGENPRILSIDRRSGYASREVNDTSRPTPLMETGNPELSLAAYLDLLEMAWGEYRGSDDIDVERDFAAVLYHTPFAGLVRQAHGVLMEASNPDADTAAIEASFQRMVAPGFSYCREIGNIYTGALFAAMVGFLDSPTAPPPGSRVALFAYGSGSCAEFFSGTVESGARELLAAKGIGKRIAGRRAATMGEYEHATNAMVASLTEQHFEPDLAQPEGFYDAAYRGRELLVLEGVRDYYRQYKWS